MYLNAKMITIKKIWNMIFISSKKIFHKKKKILKKFLNIFFIQIFLNLWYSDIFANSPKQPIHARNVL